jgi:hypothetical protein
MPAPRQGNGTQMEAAACRQVFEQGDEDVVPINAGFEEL